MAATDWTSEEGLAEIERHLAYMFADPAHTPGMPPQLLALVAEVRRLRADLAESLRSYASYSAKAETEIERLRREVAEQALRIAILTGEGVPEGWEWRQDSDGNYIRRDVPGWHACIEDDASWGGYRGSAPYDRGVACGWPRSDAHPYGAALAAASAWLAEQAEEGR